jgi:hypothetical protein
LPVHHGAQRASRSIPRLWPVLALVAGLVAGGLAAGPQPAEAAAARKVVIVVGPAGSSTADYIANARALAKQARSYGAAVYEIYSPNATWTRVRDAAQGANVLIYLGHGNGWPSPYGPFRAETKDGFGLNATANRGHYNTKYWGEYYIARYIRLAPSSVVILNRLCYASGNSEWGRANPTRTVAIQRVDNYAAGFLRTGARAVFAEGIGKADYVLYGLFRTSRTMSQIFWSARNATGHYRIEFGSSRTRGARAIMDPYAPGRYYRSVAGWPATTAAAWRAG